MESMEQYLPTVMFRVFSGCIGINEPISARHARSPAEIIPVKGHFASTCEAFLDGHPLARAETQNPQLRNADFFRSRRQSALSGKPTTLNSVLRAEPTSTSTSTRYASYPVRGGPDRFEEHLRGLPEKRASDSNEEEMAAGFSAPHKPLRQYPLAALGRALAASFTPVAATTYIDSLRRWRCRSYPLSL